MAVKKTQAQFIQELEILKERGIVLLGDPEYLGAQHRYQWKCLHDGNEWEAPFARIWNGTGCAVCGRQSSEKSKIVPLESFLERLVEHSKTHAPITYVSGYTAAMKKCTFSCDVCNHTWDTLPNSILSKGQGCPKCARTRNVELTKYDVHAAKLLLAEHNLTHRPDVELDGDYLGYSVRTGLKCSNGHRWNGVLNMLINQNTSCPTCTVDRNKT